MSTKKPQSLSKRVVTIFSTGKLKIQPEAWAQITQRTSRAFTPVFLRVAGRPQDWMIHSVAVDFGRSVAINTVGAPSLPLDMLGALRRAQKLSLIVSYRGRSRMGKPFSGSIVGKLSDK